MYYIRIRKLGRKSKAPLKKIEIFYFHDFFHDFFVPALNLVLFHIFDFWRTTTCIHLHRWETQYSSLKFSLFSSLISNPLKFFKLNILVFLEHLTSSSMLQFMWSHQNIVLVVLSAVVLINCYIIKLNISTFQAS